MNLDNFTQVKVVNPRKVKSDLVLSPKTGKFTVSEGLYERLNLVNNGFLLYVDHTENRVALAVVDNSTASIMAGKANAVKGTTFSASAMASALNKFYKNQSDFELQFMLENDGISYYEVLPEGQKEAPVAEETVSEDQHTQEEEEHDVYDREEGPSQEDEEYAF